MFQILTIKKLIEIRFYWNKKVICNFLNYENSLYLTYFHIQLKSQLDF